MQITSDFCRTQQVRHLRQADDSVLPNVKALQMRAAAAWDLEARSAEKREHRHAGARAVDARTSADCLIKENPDRGLADVT